MAKFLRPSGAMVASALAVTSCAVKAPVAPIDASQPQTVPMVQNQAGAVTVPISFPALDERSVQYAYDKNYVNTIEVRLRDSLGNMQLQYVSRNAYLAGNAAAGTARVTFYNVLPGTFTLTVRTTHLRLVSASGPIKYDAVRDVFFRDTNSNNAFDSNSESEMMLVSGNRSAQFLVFSGDALTDGDLYTLFPGDVRTDRTSTASGFGIGAGTESIVVGQTRTVSATVSAIPQWATSELGLEYVITAGATQSLKLANASDLQPIDQVGLFASQATKSPGILDFSKTIHLYSQSSTGSTVQFSPTRSTNDTLSSAPSAWPLWVVRGQACSEWGLTAYNNPKITVLPELASSANSRVFASTGEVGGNGTGTVYYDLRDKYGNPVAGNVSNVNSVSLATVRGKNVSLKMDYAVIGSSIGTDPRISISNDPVKPFLFPGVTCGYSNGAQYQAGGDPAVVSEAATYSITNANNRDNALRITRLAIPEYLWKANPSGDFNAAPSSYVLTIKTDSQNSDNKWIELKTGSTIVASASIDASLLDGRTIGLAAPVLTGQPAYPGPIRPTENPVEIYFPEQFNVAAPNNQTTFSFNRGGSNGGYGRRAIGDSDTVSARIYTGQTGLDSALMTKNITFTLK